jgi:hypothetical protein
MTTLFVTNERAAQRAGVGIRQMTLGHWSARRAHERTPDPSRPDTDEV